jgi:hypothetical protein
MSRIEALQNLVCTLRVSSWVMRVSPGFCRDEMAEPSEDS